MQVPVVVPHGMHCSLMTSCQLMFDHNMFIAWATALPSQWSVFGCHALGWNMSHASSSLLLPEGVLAATCYRHQQRLVEGCMICQAGVTASSLECY
jgi:hypothetical protein